MAVAKGLTALHVTVLDEKSDRLEDPDIDGGTGVAHCNTVCTMRQERKHAEEEGRRE